MKKIICDNNVWHRLAHGEYSNDAGENFLIGTFVNIEELVTSWELVNNLEYIKSVYFAINKHHRELFYINPIDFVLQDILPDYQPKESDFHVWLEGMDRIMKSEEGFVPSDKGNEAMVRYITANEEKYQKVSDCLNNKLATNQASFVAMTKQERTEYLKKDTIEITKDFLCLVMSDYTGKDINKGMVKWDQIELFTNTLDNFIKRLEEHLTMPEIMKVKKNDWADILNLLYVSTDKLYFTLDHKGIYKSIIASGMQKYLYEPK